MPVSVEHVRQELTFVDELLVLDEPRHLALALHLSVHEVANIVPAVRPLELAVALYLRVAQLSSVNEQLFRLHLSVRIERLLLVAHDLPLFLALAGHAAASVKVTLNLHGAVVALLHTWPAHDILTPLSFILGAVADLLEFTQAMEHTD